MGFAAAKAAMIGCAVAMVLAVAGTAVAEESAKIIRFNGKSIKLYGDSQTKSVLKKVPKAEFSVPVDILNSSKNRLSFEFGGQEVWVKKLKVTTNGVKSSSPPCPKIANVTGQTAAGNAVSRGAGQTC